MNARRARGVVALAGALLLGACFSEHTAGPGENVSFAQDVQPIFSGSCAFSGCHGPVNPNPAGKPMVLAAGQAYDAIVGVASAQLPTMDRITPGQPGQSYLIHKLEGTHASVGGSGGRMPAGAAPLAPPVIAVIRRWVMEGAARN